MSRQKGTTKTGGRKRGSRNKVFKNLKNRISNFLDSNFENAMTAWQTLEPKDKVKMYCDLLKYVVPVQKEQTVNFEEMTETDLDAIIENLKTEIIEN